MKAPQCATRRRRRGQDDLVQCVSFSRCSRTFWENCGLQVWTSTPDCSSLTAEPVQNSKNTQFSWNIRLFFPPSAQLQHTGNLQREQWYTLHGERVWAVRAQAWLTPRHSSWLWFVGTGVFLQIAARSLGGARGFFFSFNRLPVSFYTHSPKVIPHRGIISMLVQANLFYMNNFQIIHFEWERRLTFRPSYKNLEVNIQALQQEVRSRHKEAISSHALTPSLKLQL